MTPLVKSYVQDGIGFLVLADTANGNVLSAELVAEATAVHQQFINDGIRVAVLAAEGEAFCLGRDTGAVRVPGVPPAGAVLIDEIERSPIAWVAAVGGEARGPGVLLAASCIHLVVSEGAFFRVPELLNGVFPRPVAQGLSVLIGRRATMHLLITGEPLPAAEAVALGLASESVPDTDLLKIAFQRAVTLRDLPGDLLASTQEGWRHGFQTVPA